MKKVKRICLPSEIRKCLVCNKDFRAFQSQIKTGGCKYCSWNCYIKAPRVSNVVIIEKVRCLTCKKIFMSRRYRHYKYCSRKCSYKRSIWNKGRHVKTNTGRTHFKKGQTGNKCVNWKGGISFEPYGLKFNNELKDKIRKRDGYRCQECFRHQNELFKNTKNGYKSCKLYVHHIDYDKKNCNSRNLISLCLSCHMKTNWNRSNWTKYFSK